MTPAQTPLPMSDAERDVALADRVIALEQALRLTTDTLSALASQSPWRLAGMALWGQDSQRALAVVQIAREVLHPYWACGCPIKRDLAGVDVHQEWCHDND